jgi:hypothetical protein
MGFLITGLGFVYLTWNVIEAFVTGRRAPGWASLFAVSMMVGT